MSIEEAFRNKVSPDKPEKQTSRDEKENAAELHKSKESEGVPQGHAEEYTELPLHALAHDSMFTPIPTGRAYLLLVESTACLWTLWSTACLFFMYLMLPPHEMRIPPVCLFSSDRLFSE